MTRKSLHIDIQHKAARSLKLLTAALFITVSLFFFVCSDAANAAFMSKAWENLLEKRSSSIITESIELEGLRIGGRGRITFTWLDRSLMRILQNDNYVDESISNGLSYYYSNKKEVKNFIKNRDIFLLSYQAIKRWDFKIEEIVINGYRLSVDDILTPNYKHLLGEIPPIKELMRAAEEMSTVDNEFYADNYQLHVAVPSMPKKGSVKISYGDDTEEWEIPKK